MHTHPTLIAWWFASLIAVITGQVLLDNLAAELAETDPIGLALSRCP